MSVGRICSRVVVTASPGENARAAARRMADNEVGTLVIMDGWRPRQAVGILTDRDIAWHVAGIRHLVVPGEDNNVAGLLSLDDVLDVMVGETAAIGRLLERQKPRALRASAGADP